MTMEMRETPLLGMHTMEAGGADRLGVLPPLQTGPDSILNEYSLEEFKLGRTPRR